MIVQSPSASTQDNGDVLFFGATLAQIIGYEVRDSSALRHLEKNDAELSLRSSASALHPQVEEKFSNSKTLLERRDKLRQSGSISCAAIKAKPNCVGSLHWCSPAVLPVLLQTVAPMDTDIEAEWKRESGADGKDVTKESEDEQTKPSKGNTEKKNGLFTLSAEISIELTLPNGGGDEASRFVSLGVKTLTIDSLPMQANGDLCVVSRVFLAEKVLADGLYSVLNSVDFSAPSVDIECEQGIVLTLMLRTLSLGRPVSAMVDADSEVRLLLCNSEGRGPFSQQFTESSRYQHLTRSCRAVPYGVLPLAIMHELYAFFCEESYYCRPIGRKRGVSTDLWWRSSPALCAAEASRPCRWNALDSWGYEGATNANGYILGEADLTPLLLTLSHCPNLARLNFSGNQLTDFCCARIAALFAGHRCLKEVQLEHNKFYEIGADAILRLVRRNKRIEEVHLDGNKCAMGPSHIRMRKILQDHQQAWREDPLQLFSSQYEYLVSPDSLPEEVVREALGVWSQLTAAPVGDVDVWLRNSTTEDFDRYVDESVLPRLTAAQEAYDAPSSITPLVARAPLLSEIMRSVCTAMWLVIADPVIRSLFADVDTMESCARCLNESEAYSVEEAFPGILTGLESVGKDALPEVFSALKLSESKKPRGIIESDELYNVSFIRIIVSTFRAIEHGFWEEVVGKLQQAGKRQAELGVTLEDYWLAIHVFLRSLQLSFDSGKYREAHNPEQLTPNAVYAVLAVLALGFRTAVLSSSN